VRSETLKIAAVGIATGYVLDGPSSIPGSVRFSLFHSVQSSSWGPPSLLSNEYRGLFPPEGKATGDVKLSTHLHIVRRS
jgi:hypothetical protein